MYMHAFILIILIPSLGGNKKLETQFNREVYLMRFLSIFLCAQLCTFECLCHMHKGPGGGQKKLSDLLELELQGFVGAGN